ncbi:MAG: DMSO/TMAO reductase YedYZ molybdopterin-dependent catalytic subunit [Arenicella sp.]|jgi:DMSO/TMAO reductase YedYZ molybdopterin-dependent catalytic subunit
MSKKESRRSFIGKSALATLAAVVGSKVVFADNFPDDLEPIGLETDEVNEKIPGKSDQLTILNRKPWNAETPPHLLDDEVTPAHLMFVRNNGIPPYEVDVQKWTLTIDGESVDKPKSFSLKELMDGFDHHSYKLTLECGGNGRSEFNPPAKGNQWGLGGVACSKWTGVRLKDVLNKVGIKDNAVYIGYYGADTHLSGDLEKDPISRGVPIRKALEEETLIAWAMNDEAIPAMNGFPLRLVCGGWPASVSGKWLTRISVRDKEHDGAKMGGHSYRVPKFPVPPGTKVPDDQMKIIESMPVKSIITYPKTGAVIPKGGSFEVRGNAWAGDLKVDKVEVSIDFGVNWTSCELKDPANRLAWQRWSSKVKLPEFGYYEIWARATDEKGVVQPMVLPGWNPKGYLNNASHRIALRQA